MGACLTSGEGENIPQDGAVGEKALFLDPASQNSLTDGIRNMPSLPTRLDGLMSENKAPGKKKSVTYFSEQQKVIFSSSTKELQLNLLAS